MGTTQLIVITALVAILGLGCATAPPPTPFSADLTPANRDAIELEDFRHQYARLRVLDPHRETGEFRSVAQYLFTAMEREVQQAEAVGAPHTTRVRAIFEECRGLRWGVARGNAEAIARGLDLLGQFVREMEADLESRRELMANERPKDSVLVR